MTGRGKRHGEGTIAPMNNLRIVQLGTTTYSADSEAKVRGIATRQGEIETCDAAVFVPTEVVHLETGLAELCFATKHGRQTIYVDHDRGGIEPWHGFLMRSTTHYLRLGDVDKKVALVHSVIAHACGERLSLAYAEDLAALLEKTESPPEERLAVHLSNACEMAFKLEAQVPIAVNGSNYRADFMVSDADFDVKIVVEVDGHNFHERTKEQAKRDRSRDRAMLAGGYYVMRFTGSEVWQEPRRCAREVYDFAQQRVDAAVGPPGEAF